MQTVAPIVRRKRTKLKISNTLKNMAPTLNFHSKSMIVLKIFIKLIHTKLIIRHLSDKQCMALHDKICHMPVHNNLCCSCRSQLGSKYILKNLKNKQKIS